MDNNADEKNIDVYTCVSYSNIDGNSVKQYYWFTGKRFPSFNSSPRQQTAYQRVKGPIEKLNIGANS